MSKGRSEFKNRLTFFHSVNIYGPSHHPTCWAVLQLRLGRAEGYLRDAMAYDRRQVINLELHASALPKSPDALSVNCLQRVILLCLHHASLPRPSAGHQRPKAPGRLHTLGLRNGGFVFVPNPKDR